MAKPKAELIYANTIPAEFVRRINRFTAEVRINGQMEIIHVKNTGRLRELLLPKAKVTLQKAGDPNRKTAYDLISVYKPRLEWVNIDSLAPNILMRQYLETMDFYDLVKPEYQYGDSRIDFYMEHGTDRYLTEVKGCTLADDQKKGIGLFPDAPTERGVKHLHELTRASREGYHCSIAFVIQMNGIHLVYPNDETQPEFRKALEEAVHAGVQVNCLSCHVEADRIKISGIAVDSERYKNSEQFKIIDMLSVSTALQLPACCPGGPPCAPAGSHPLSRSPLQTGNDSPPHPAASCRSPGIRRRQTTHLRELENAAETHI